MRIKKYRQLVAVLRDADNSTRMLNYVEFYRDGTWTEMSCSTYSHSYKARVSISCLLEFRETGKTKAWLELCLEDVIEYQNRK